MPDPYRKLTRAVVDIATQARRIADAMTTPVVRTEVASDDDATTPVYCPLCPRMVPLSDPQAATEHFRTKHPEHPLVGPGPWPRLCLTPETHNWGCGCPTDTSTLRMELNAQRQRADQAEARAAVCREDAEHNATRAERAEQQRAKLAATLRDVLALFDRVTGHGTVKGYRFSGFIAPEDFERWRAVLDQPATEEQHAPAEQSPHETEA